MDNEVGNVKNVNKGNTLLRTGGIKLFYNNKKTIGVFIAQVNAEFQDLLSRGISTKAMELDYNVAFFTNFGGYGQPSYDTGEIMITDLPNYEELDGVIFASDTMNLEEIKERYLKNIRNRCHCPVVSVRTELKEFYNILVDNNDILSELIIHYIEVHGFTRINFLAGPKGRLDSDKRLECYKRILNEHNIPVEEDRIYYGDFWKYTGVDAVEHWLNSPLELPQAIVCANDYMAITVCRALAEKGIAVPDQIAVSGCDDIEDAAEFSPSLTTVRMPIFEMGAAAVNTIHQLNLGVEQPRNTYMKPDTIYRASCGCKRNWYHESNERRRNHIIAREELYRAIIGNAFMSTDLAGLTKLEDVSEKIGTYIYENKNFTHFCLCLHRNWDFFHEEGGTEPVVDDDRMIMEIGFKNRMLLSKIKFSKKNLIPKEMAEEQAMIYYFAILHHQDHYFGYAGIRFDAIQTYMLSFQTWLFNVCNALENVRIHGELRRLVYRLEDMSVRDELTGLYNRRVMDTLGKKYLMQCVEKQAKLMVFTADMDKLKYINDNYGHAKGDMAIKAVADALLKAADDDEICIRLGGDEFMAIGIDYDDNKMMKFVLAFVDELNEFNKNSDTIYLYVSYGWHIVLPDENTSLEECLMVADSHMYKQKYDKASNHIRANLPFTESM
ncbi:GGDEF domain-containing protein [Lachnospiraceae bacterium MD1]|uniref:GGDEF domain-containing protein n=1 Tax=Variimorphobacter saccharofermentans TaxID=2755051 RepID=A0A839JXE1_9FIRM|nr:GGDEF domain-containing protein [Variimorphobacter saccharofermentans]MBB2181289.1 GGDEF domain-containing protein [Variimorphobacter saccharofermentans]